MKQHQTGAHAATSVFLSCDSSEECAMQDVLQRAVRISLITILQETPEVAQRHLYKFLLTGMLGRFLNLREYMHVPKYKIYWLSPFFAIHAQVHSMYSAGITRANRGSVKITTEIGIHRKGQTAPAMPDLTQPKDAIMDGASQK
jgi:hypothetical protein